MELHIEDETVEPSLSRAAHRQAFSPVVERPRIKWSAIQSRLEGRVSGRMLLDVIRWSVVAALITTGYFAAAGIDCGVTALRSSNAADAQQMLATSTAHK